MAVALVVVEATVGTLLFVAIAMISVWTVRRRVSFETWHGVHLLTYVAIALSFLHELAGPDLAGRTAVQVLWTLMHAYAFALVLRYRVIAAQAEAAPRPPPTQFHDLDELEVALPARSSPPRDHCRRSCSGEGGGRPGARPVLRRRARPASRTRWATASRSRSLNVGYVVAGVKYRLAPDNPFEQLPRPTRSEGLPS